MNELQIDDRCLDSSPTLTTLEEIGKPGMLSIPEEAQPIRVYWPYTVSLSMLHLLALLVFIPGFFSWSGLWLAIFGHIVFDGLGVSIGYHRLLTHRGFECPKWFEKFVAILGVCTLQDSPARWVAVHRMHHQHSDHQPDPHSPLVNFFWGHVGWLLSIDRRHDSVLHFERYARDLLREPFYLFLERKFMWLWIYLAHSAAIYFVGVASGWIYFGTLSAGIQLGLSWLVWAVFARTVFTLHVTWAVNSVAHLWGYQNYQTRDNSRNNWLVAALTFGEGWHNNHHADQRSAQHGHRWWELDPSWWMIHILQALGIAKNIIGPRNVES